MAARSPGIFSRREFAVNCDANGYYDSRDDYSFIRGEEFALMTTQESTEILLISWVEPSIGHVSSGRDECKTWCLSGIQYCGIAPRLNGRLFKLRLKPIAGFEAGCWGIGKTVDRISPNGTRQKPQMSAFHVPGVEFSISIDDCVGRD